MTRYWAGEGGCVFRLADSFIDAEAYARRHDYPREDYFGLGPASLRRNHTDYAIQATTIGARAAVRPCPIVAIGGGLEHIDAGLFDGSDPSVPSISEVFDDRSAPGLTPATRLHLRSIVFIDVDWRRPLNARKGGWYRAEVSRYDDRQGLGFSFDRLDVDLRQYVSFLSERRVLVGRVAASTSNVEPDEQVPFYLMPTTSAARTPCAASACLLSRAARLAAAGRISL